MNKEKIYYVKALQGCALRLGSDSKTARKAALRELGTDNVKSIRLATRKDIEWVRSMGGRVPTVSQSKPDCGE